MPDSKPEKPRVRVELRTPAGTVHRADQSLSESLTDLITRCEKTRDNHDIMKMIEGVVDTGASAMMKLARALVKSLRGGS